MQFSLEELRYTSSSDSNESSFFDDEEQLSGISEKQSELSLQENIDDD